VLHAQPTSEKGEALFNQHCKACHDPGVEHATWRKISCLQRSR
jgi:cytochrome c5